MASKHIMLRIRRMGVVSTKLVEGRKSGGKKEKGTQVEGLSLES